MLSLSPFRSVPSGERHRVPCERRLREARPGTGWAPSCHGDAGPEELQLGHGWWMGEPAARLDRDGRHHEVEHWSRFRASVGSLLVQVSPGVLRTLWAPVLSHDCRGQSAAPNDVWWPPYSANIVFHHLLLAVVARPFSPAHTHLCVKSIYFPPSLRRFSH